MLGLLVVLLPVGNSLNISNANAIAVFDNQDKKTSKCQFIEM